MISRETITAMCEEAGIDPNRVKSIEIAPFDATFTVYSTNIYGEKMINRERTTAITHWVKVPITW